MNEIFPYLAGLVIFGFFLLVLAINEWRTQRDPLLIPAINSSLANANIKLQSTPTNAHMNPAPTIDTL